MKPTFSRFSSFWVRLRTIFRWLAPVFPRSTVYFLSHSPILNPNSRDFSRVRHSFQPRTSIFPRSVLYFPILRALLREISPFIIATLLFSHSVKAFSFRASLSLPSSSPSFSIDFLSAPQSPHPLHYSPTFFLIPPHFYISLPTFTSPSPINARSCAPSRTTRVRVHPHTRTRQEVFIYCLHRFTHPSQFAVHQCVRGEEKREKAFTKNSITSQSIH